MGYYVQGILHVGLCAVLIVTMVNYKNTLAKGKTYKQRYSSVSSTIPNVIVEPFTMVATLLLVKCVCHEKHKVHIDEYISVDG